MGKLRYIYTNKIPASTSLSVNSQKTGYVTIPIKESATASGDAIADTTGYFTGSRTVNFTVQIDSTKEGSSVGAAKFRWSTDGSTSNWSAQGVFTDSTWITLNDGVQIKWSTSTTTDFVVGDTWTFRGENPWGMPSLYDWDRDTRWRSTATSGNILADMGESISDNLLTESGSTMITESTKTLKTEGQ